MEFHLVQNRKENCHHDHIPFNLKGNGILVFSVCTTNLCRAQGVHHSKLTGCSNWDCHHWVSETLSDLGPIWANFRHPLKPLGTILAWNKRGFRWLLIGPLYDYERHYLLNGCTPGRCINSRHRAFKFPSRIVTKISCYDYPVWFLILHHFESLRPPGLV